MGTGKRGGGGGGRQGKGEQRAGKGMPLGPMSHCTETTLTMMCEEHGAGRPEWTHNHA